MQCCGSGSICFYLISASRIRITGNSHKNLTKLQEYQLIINNKNLSFEYIVFALLYFLYIETGCGFAISGNGFAGQFKIKHCMKHNVFQINRINRINHIAELYNEKGIHIIIKHSNVQGGPGYSLPVFKTQPFPVWGLTAIITYQLLKAFVPPKHYMHKLQFQSNAGKLQHDMLFIQSNNKCDMILICIYYLLGNYLGRILNDARYLLKSKMRYIFLSKKVFFGKDQHMLL